jgi:hypothetical protein
VFCRDCRHAAREDDGFTLASDGACLNPKTGYAPSYNKTIHFTLMSMSENRKPKTFWRRFIWRTSAPDRRCGPEGVWFEPMFSAPDAQANWVKMQEKADA